VALVRGRAGTIVEWVAAGVAALGAAVLATANLLRGDVFEGDAFVHQYWMRSYTDDALFTDPLTADLRESERYPDGYELLFRAAAQVTDPIAFGEWVGVAMMAASGLLVFAIVRAHTPWRPAAWIAGALFLALDGHRFYGGFPRGFLHVVVLLTVLLAVTGRRWPAAITAAGGVLLYPPAGLVAMGTLVLATVRIRRWRPSLDRERLWPAALALVLTGAVIVVSTFVAGGGAPDFMSADEARRYPQFGERGDLHFFVDSTLEYLRQNRSGFDLRATGSMLLIATAALLLARRANWRLLRPEVIAMPLVALMGFTAAQATLFKLYLPHRYTYPLLAFFAIAVGVTLLPTWQALTQRSRRVVWALAALAAPVAIAVLAIYVFPLGPQRPFLDVNAVRIAAAAAGAVALGVAAYALRARAALGAALTGVLMLALVLAAPGRKPPGQGCPQTPAVRFLASLPKDTIIAGDPLDLKCMPVSARRPVVISGQLAPSYEEEYFLKARARMFAMLSAYYGRSPEAITALRERYGADVLFVRREALRREAEEPEGVRWQRFRHPYGRFVRDLLEQGSPAALDLPDECRIFRDETNAVYRIDCIARAMRARQRSGTA
jgi:hypothetical protein